MLATIVGAGADLTSPLSQAMLTSSKYRLVTRQQVQTVKNVFPFLQLPPELRHLIYGFAIDHFEGIRAIFRATHHALCLAHRNRSQAECDTALPEPTTFTPAIFLLNKQIFLEASALLHKRHVIFDHGLLTVLEVSSVISPSVLRSVGSITINDAGHQMLQGKICPESWHGYIRLLHQLADILKAGHQLKSLTIQFSDPRLTEHVTDCFGETKQACAFAAHMRGAMHSLDKIRSVGTVTLSGLNPKMAAELKKRMQSKPRSFFDLPSEVRAMVYRHAADWSEGAIAFDRATSESFKIGKTTKTVTRKTPSILLLSRQITQEALPIIRAKPLVVRLPSDLRFAHASSFQAFLQYVPVATLQHVQELEVTIEYWYHIQARDCEFLEPFRTSSVLRSLHMHFIDRYYPRLPSTPDALQLFDLSAFATVRGLAKVVISGDIPLMLAEQIGRIMTTIPRAGEELPRAFWPAPQRALLS